MKAVVLVGGFGTRLRPLTLARPKQMLPVGHVTMLEQVIARLGECGVTEVVLSLGYRPDVFTTAFPDQLCAGVSLVYAQEPEPLDTAGAIAFAARAADIGETFFALNGDVLSDIDLPALWRRHGELGTAATIALTPVDDPSRYGVVVTDDSDRVLEFVEKPPAGSAPSNWINAGSYVLEPSVLDLIPANEKVSIERVTFPKLVEQGRLAAIGDSAYWLDAGTHETYLQANTDLVDGRRGSRIDAIASTASVDQSALVGGSVVGADAVIGADAIVEHSVIMPRAVIESGAVVRGSIVGEGSTVGAGAILDSLSVVGFGCSVGAGQRLSHALVPPAEEWS